MGLCVLLQATRVPEEHQGGEGAGGGLTGGGGGAGVLFRNHGNQTGSLHKLCSSPPFFDVFKAMGLSACGCISISKKRLKTLRLMWPDYLSHRRPAARLPPHRASISRDPFYDMLATRKRRIANKK